MKKVNLAHSDFLGEVRRNSPGETLRERGVQERSDITIDFSQLYRFPRGTPIHHPDKTPRIEAPSSVLDGTPEANSCVDVKQESRGWATQRGKG